jgi:hypothetical protein
VYLSFSISPLRVVGTYDSQLVLKTSKNCMYFLYVFLKCQIRQPINPL